MDFSDVASILALGGVGFLLYEHRRASSTPPIKVRAALSEAVKCTTKGKRGKPPVTDGSSYGYDWVYVLAGSRTNDRELARELGYLVGEFDNGPPRTEEAWERARSRAVRARGRWDELDGWNNRRSNRIVIRSEEEETNWLSRPFEAERNHRNDWAD